MKTIVEFYFSGTSSFLGWREYDLLFDIDIVNLLLKNKWGEIEGLMLLL